MGDGNIGSHMVCSFLRFSELKKVLDKYYLVSIPYLGERLLKVGIQLHSRPGETDCSFIQASGPSKQMEMAFPALGMSFLVPTVDSIYS